MEMVRTVSVVVVGAALLDRLGVPAGALIGGMLAVALVQLLGPGASGVPGIVRFAAFAVIGWDLGSGFGPDTVRLLRSAAVPVVAVVVGLLVAAAGVTYVLVRFGFDPVTAFLSASPGGISQMAALSSELGANGVLVATVHLARVVAVILISPLVARALAGG